MSTAQHAALAQHEAQQSWEVWWGDPADLARYVVPATLRDLALGRVEPHRDLKLRVRRLFERLAAADIEYAHEPWTSQGVQQIRDPHWMVRDRWGTCIDLSLTFAAMCLEAGVRPMLAIDRRHAFVVVDVSTPLADSTGKNGLIVVDDALLDKVDTGQLLAIDCVYATSGKDDFDAAVRVGRGYLALTSTLVNVAYLQSIGEKPQLPVPGRRPPLSLYLRGGEQRGEQRFLPYEGQRTVIDWLSGASGTVALLGPSGQGKSTLAREVIMREPLGSAWFLNASELKTLSASMADAELADLNRSATATADVDKRGFAEAAMKRLSETDDRWVVVLDNADGDPHALQSLVPRPGSRQLVLITSTNRDWELVPGVTVVFLPGVDDVQVARELGMPDLVFLVAGRPLLLEAFRALKQAAGLSDQEIATCVRDEDRLADELRGPLALWRAARAAGLINDSDLALCLEIAYLPPGQQPVAVLQDLHNDAERTIAALTCGGLADQSADGFLRMHRLVGAAIRRELGATVPVLDNAVVTGLTSDLALRGVLDRYGDLATIERLDDRLGEIDDRLTEPDVAVGIALHGSAGLLELHGQTRRSERTYSRAERHLSTRPDLYADVLHSKARTVNQHSARDEDKLRQALAWAQEAERLLGGVDEREATAARCVAMQGLLRQKLAAFPREGESTLSLLKEALAVIEEAHRRREGTLAPSDPELARSEFNLAGIRINLAKFEPERTREHLDRAAEVYEAVLTRRRDEIYRRPVHAHIAACIIGLAYVDYFRALLIPTSREQRAAWLRSSTRHAHDALLQRQELDGTSDGDESRKASRFLAKVALLRHAPDVEPTTALDAVTAEVAAEVAYAAVPRLPSRADRLDGPIAAWARSAPLAAVVGAFGGTLPSLATPIGEVLAWLDDFSTRWDFRGGRERNMAATDVLPPGAVEVVARAAAALGLIGTSSPASVRYDHVLILGGLLRGCLTRPSYARDLIDRGVIEAGSITALAAFRPLRGDELELSERFGLTGVADELDAMDAGVRAAFSLDSAQYHDRSELSDVVGASWCVRTYDCPGQKPVRVVAAPSSAPGERRANTADAYEWFISNLGDVTSGQRILAVTTDIYVPYQHADALRMLALPHGVEVDAVGIRPGDVDESLEKLFGPHDYLQELRSTIRALRALNTALEQRLLG